MNRKSHLGTESRLPWPAKLPSEAWQAVRDHARTQAFGHPSRLKAELPTLLAALLLLLAFSVPAADVTFNLANFARTSATNRKGYLEYLDAGGGTNQTLITYDKLPITTDTNGLCLVTNVTQGTYHLQIAAPPATSDFYFLFPLTNGAINAFPYLIAPTNQPFPPGSTAWAVAVSDGRYQPQATNQATATAGQAYLWDPVAQAGYFGTVSGGSGGGITLQTTNGSGLIITTNASQITASVATNLFDLAGTAAAKATAATNVLGGAAYVGTNTFDLAGTAAAKATAATNVLGGAAYFGTNTFDLAGTAAAKANAVGLSTTNFVLATGSAANPSGAYWEIASIISSNSFAAPLTCPNWLYGFYPSIAPFVLTDLSGNFVLDANRGSGDVGWFIFSYPSNSTAVTFSASVSSYNGNSTTLGFGLKAIDNSANYNWNGAWAIPASGWTNITVTYSSYQALLAAAIIPADAVVISNLSLTFAGTTNLALQGSFRRWEVLPSYVTHSAFVGNIQKANNPTAAPFPGPDTVVSFTTTAPYATLEIYNGNVSSEISVFTNGQYLKTVSSPDSGKYQYVDILLGTNLPVRVDVVSDYAVSDLEASVRAIYVPGTNSVILMNRRPQRRVLCYGDSILSPGNEAFNTVGTLSKQIERMLDAEVSLYSTGGRKLYDDWNTDWKRSLMVKSIAAYQPTDIMVEMGRNDWYFTSYATTNLWATDYAAMVDTLHNANPGASFYLMSPTVNANETTNSSGATPTAGGLFNDFRLCVKGIALARSNFCAFIDGPSLLVTGDLADGVHPSGIGNPKLGWQIAKAMYYFPTNTAAVTPYGNYAGTFTGNGAGLTNLPGGSGSYAGAFNANQFGSNSLGTYLKSGATVTNLAISGGASLDGTLAFNPTAGSSTFQAGLLITGGGLTTAGATNSGGHVSNLDVGATALMMQSGTQNETNTTLGAGLGLSGTTLSISGVLPAVDGGNLTNRLVDVTCGFQSIAIVTGTPRFCPAVGATATAIGSATQVAGSILSPSAGTLTNILAYISSVPPQVGTNYTYVCFTNEVSCGAAYSLTFVGNGSVGSVSTNTAVRVPAGTRISWQASGINPTTSSPYVTLQYQFLK